MNKKETGGPAFPFTGKSDPDFYGRTTSFIKGGMTLRDYFAGQALGEVMSKVGVHEEVGKEYLKQHAAKHIAEASYILADAMLEARK